MWWVLISSELPVIFSSKVFITCIYLFMFIGGCHDVFYGNQRTICMSVFFYRIGLGSWMKIIRKGELNHKPYTLTASSRISSYLCLSLLPLIWNQPTVCKFVCTKLAICALAAWYGWLRTDFFFPYHSSYFLNSQAEIQFHILSSYLQQAAIPSCLS